MQVSSPEVFTDKVDSADRDKDEEDSSEEERKSAEKQRRKAKEQPANNTGTSGGSGTSKVESNMSQEE